MNLIKENTPIQMIQPGLFVKREDLCIGGPSFSKLRGVYAHLANRGEDVVGVLDTYHSKAGWGVSLLCEQMHKRAVVFYPVYKSDILIRGNQLAAKKHGAHLIGLTAGRSCILYHQAKNELQDQFPGAYMIPNALKLEESITETAKEVWTVPEKFLCNTTWVISISSGTIAAGVLKGLFQRSAGRIEVIIHMGYTRSEDAVRMYFHNSCGFDPHEAYSIRYIDQGYQYKDAVKYPCPIPCNPFYDLKAWKWIQTSGILQQNKQILMWNIGA
jgi:1-aminocyclopropane-1-carboxylate deaminase/D-cysteine desulfhydrase-like pyridoxal-dependent ACC family enzyme